MPKNLPLTSIDFDFGIGKIIPATQEAYRSGFDAAMRKAEKESLSVFKTIIGSELDSRLVKNEMFPTDGEVFIFVIQYFAGEKEYGRRDIDNMSKTVLDLLKGRFYRDDSQVKTLLVGKKLEKRVPQDFAYIAIKRLTASQDVDALKISGLERSVTLFQELKARRVL
ncbi:MAG: RusA family crossover junction endodeoxyribonuclease [bacterium]